MSNRKHTQPKADAPVRKYPDWITHKTSTGEPYDITATGAPTAPQPAMQGKGKHTHARAAARAQAAQPDKAAQENYGSGYPYNDYDRLAAELERVKDQLFNVRESAMKLSHQVSEQTSKLQTCEQQRDELLAAHKSAQSHLAQARQCKPESMSAYVSKHMGYAESNISAAIARAEGRAK